MKISSNVMMFQHRDVAWPVCESSSIWHVKALSFGVFKEV